MQIDLKSIPKKSGVYFFRDKHGRLLYIGKAIDLRNRVKSYFSNKPGNPRIAKLLELADKITWQETNSEIEALILESQLIKKHKPPFNVMLRDDKQYFHVIFSKDKFSKLFITHQPATYSDFIGPFTDGGALKITLRLLRRIFPYCTCKQKHNNYCLNYHIGKCLGFCCLKNIKLNSQEIKKYQSNIKSIKDILSGKRTLLIKKLEKNMAGLARKEEFKEAIELRDKINGLKKIFENALILRNAAAQIHAEDTQNRLFVLKKFLKLKSLPKRIEGYDISNIQGQFATGSMVVFSNGQIDKSQYRKFKIRIENSPNDIAMLKEVLIRRFNHLEWLYPNLIVIDGGIGQLNAALEIIKSKDLEIRVIALTKNDRHRGDHIFLDNKKTTVPIKTLPESVRNIILQIDAEAHRFVISYYRKLHSKLD